LQQLLAGVETKNTFLACESPWVDPASLDERPDSDPTSSSTSSELGPSSGAGPNDADAACGAASEEELLGRRRQLVEWAREHRGAHRVAAEPELDAATDRGASEEPAPAPSRAQQRRLQRSTVGQGYATALASSGGDAAGRQRAAASNGATKISL